MPFLSKIARTRSLLNDWRSTALRRSITGRGVAAGANSACQNCRSRFL